MQLFTRVQPFMRVFAVVAAFLLVAAACAPEDEEVEDPVGEPEADDDVEAPDDAVVADGDEFTLRVGFLVSAEALGGELIQTFKEEVEAGSDGRITVERFDDAALGGESDMIGQVVDGTLDMALLGSGVVSTVASTSNITELPFMWETQDQIVDVVFEGPIGDEIAAELEENGIKLLGWGEWGPRDIFTAVPLETVDDLSGLQIRVVENPLYLATLESWGAVPIGIPWPEVYGALQGGVVEAVDTNAFGFVDASLYEVTTHVIPTGHIHTALGFLLNLNRWENMSEADQQLIQEAAAAGETASRERAPDERDLMFDTLRDEGLEFVEIDIEPLRGAALDIQDEWAQGEGWSDLLEQARELRDG